MTYAKNTGKFDLFEAARSLVELTTDCRSRSRLWYFAGGRNYDA